MSDPEPIVVRSVTVSEVMDADGAQSLEVRYDGEPALWDVLGMLMGAVEAVRMDLRDVFRDND